MVFESLDLASKESKRSDRKFQPTSSSDLLARMKVKDAYITKVLEPFLSQERVIFNKFDLASDDPVFVDPLKAKSKKGNLKLKLKKALKFQEKLKKLPKTEAEKIKKDKSWQSAVTKAQGQKIKDDPELIKKSIKKKESIKKMHKKKWDERTQKQKHVQEIAKKKKAKNIDKRREQKRNSKKR